MFTHSSTLMHQLVRDRHDHVRKGRDRTRLRRTQPSTDDPLAPFPLHQ